MALRCGLSIMVEAPFLPNWHWPAPLDNMEVMKALLQLICIVLVTGCVSVYAQQDAALQTLPILANELLKRQFTVDSVTSSAPSSAVKFSDSFVPDQYQGPETANEFLKQTLTTAFGNLNYLGTGNSDYKISANIEALESGIERKFLVPTASTATTRVAYTVSGAGIFRQFLITSDEKILSNGILSMNITWGKTRRQAIENNVKKFLAELSTEGQGSIYESIAALNKTPTPQSNERVSANGSAVQQPSTPARFAIQANATKPDTDGSFFIIVQTGANTASLIVDDEEQGASEQGSYTVRRLARVGQANIIKISAVDRNGNTDTKTISVVRQAVDSRPAFARLTPDKIKPRPARDAVAIIIGIQNYKLIPKAEYANQDAQVFYDYASRALGIQQENIKLLVDDEADVSGIYKAFQNWLPLKVRKGKTDVYVFYSGHGLPSADGKSLYFLPVGADRDLIAKTAISQKEIVDALKSAQPKSVTMFIDSCYSGQIRTGETLLASARPVVLTVQDTAYPPEFTVITASASDQIASSSPDLKHGIFSYYLMKFLEGEADENKDGTITIGKLQSYLAERVPRFAMTMSRKQEPQLTGDANRVLVAR